jgi:hypothetical protein
MSGCMLNMADRDEDKKIDTLAHSDSEDRAEGLRGVRKDWQGTGRERGKPRRMAVKRRDLGSAL